MWKDYVWISSKNMIKLAEHVTKDDKEIVYIGRFLSFEEAKMYHESCIKD